MVDINLHFNFMFPFFYDTFIIIISKSLKLKRFVISNSKQMPYLPMSMYWYESHAYISESLMTIDLLMTNKLLNLNIGILLCRTNFDFLLRCTVYKELKEKYLGNTP